MLALRVISRSAQALIAIHSPKMIYIAFLIAIDEKTEKNGKIDTTRLRRPHRTGRLCIRCGFHAQTIFENHLTVGFTPNTLMSDFAAEKDFAQILSESGLWRSPISSAAKNGGRSMSDSDSLFPQRWPKR